MFMGLQLRYKLCDRKNNDPKPGNMSDDMAKRVKVVVGIKFANYLTLIDEDSGLPR